MGESSSQLGEPIIRAVNVGKKYKDTLALDNASLSVYPGDFVAIIGTSGSGKSTLLHLLGCVDVPSSGEVFVQGRSTRHLKDRELATIRNREIGFVFQFFYLQPHLNLAKNLEVPLMPRRVNSKERREHVRHVAELVGLSDKLKAKPSELSGGQLQRAAIARALIGKPKIILADEPTGNLDSGNTQKIIDLLIDIRAKTDVALVVVTHDESIAEMADRVVKIKDGVLSDA